jgi:uncharacterized protein
VIIADTSALLALFNRREPAHAAVAEAVRTRRETLVVSPYVVAELDYLVATRLGVDAELAVLAELAGGAYDLAEVDADGLAACSAVIGKYRKLDIGLADASIVVLADERRTRTVLTLDHRHFDVVRPLDGGHFSVLP